MDKLHNALATTFKRSPRYRIDDDCGIVAAADQNVFGPFQIFYYSLTLSHDVQIELFDLGLTNDQRRWCDSLPNLKVRNLSEVGPLLVSPHIKMWQTWNKPLYIEAASFKYKFWLDVDCFIYGDLRPAVARLKRIPLLVKDPALATSVKNLDSLYRFAPVPNRILSSPVNGGVCGFQVGRNHDDQLISTWKEMIIESQNKPDVGRNIRWYDQGALNWAIEKLGFKNYIWHEQKYCMPGQSYHAVNSTDFITQRITHKDSPAIAHYAGANKPWAGWKSDFILGADSKTTPTQICTNDLKIYVLWHNDNRRHTQFYRWYHEYVNLGNLGLDEDLSQNVLAENRIFLWDGLSPDTEYVGVCTAKWNEKYRNFSIPLENLHTLFMYKDTVWAGQITGHDWAVESEKYHPGIYNLLREMSEVAGVPLKNGQTLLANNFICHRDVFYDFLKFWKKIFWHFHNKYHFDLPFTLGKFDKTRPAAYFYERVAMLYFANRPDLIIRQANYPKEIKF